MRWTREVGVFHRVNRSLDRRTWRSEPIDFGGSSCTVNDSLFTQTPDQSQQFLTRAAQCGVAIHGLP